MMALLRHDNVGYEDQTVYVTGNAFFGCQFVRCVLVLRGVPFHLEKCSFVDCMWHLDVAIHDREQLNVLLEFLQGARESLPRLPDQPPTAPPPA